MVLPEPKSLLIKGLGSRVLFVCLVFCLGWVFLLVVVVVVWFFLFCGVFLLLFSLFWYFGWLVEYFWWE